MVKVRWVCYETLLATIHISHLSTGCTRKNSQNFTTSTKIAQKHEKKKDEEKDRRETATKYFLVGEMGGHRKVPTPKRRGGGALTKFSTHSRHN